jgi:hypothetical protein
MTRKVTVKPKSSKSKNRLINTMGNNQVCIVEQDKGDGMLFLASQNQKYFFWVNISEDCNWECEWEVL